jgi:HEAT repeat protein
MPEAPAQPKLIGLQRTLAVLAETKNEAALTILIPALDSSDETIQESTLRTIIARRSPIGQREVLRRLHRGGERWRRIIGDGHGHLTQALRDAVLGADAQMCSNACDAILWFREYDLMQSLITAAEDDSNENAALAARTLLALADLLYEQLSGPRDYSDRRDPQLVRAHVLTAIENSVRRFNKHNRTEIMTAFLTLAGRDNAVLKQILIDPLHPVYLAVVDGLLHQERPGVMRLLLSYLDDPHSPSAAMGVLARRSDLRFIQLVMRKIGYEPSAVANTNLKRVESIPWLRGKFEILDQLDEASQHSAIKMLMASSVKRTDAFKVVEHVLAKGTVGGRRMAAETLAQFHGAEANTVALKALTDDDPRVQAIVVSQLRARGIPGALTRLIELVDSPYEIVRKAASESLGEFDYDRYVSAFDLLEEDVRRSTGLLVKKINPHAIPSLREEMNNQSRTKRLRAIAMAHAMGAVGQLEETIIARLQDEDHLVRVEAATALGAFDSQAIRVALREALHDRAVAVQEAAESSLQRLAQQQRDPIIIANSASQATHEVRR